MSRRHAHRASWLDDDRINAVLWLIAVAIILVGLCAVPPEWLEAAR